MIDADAEREYPMAEAVQYITNEKGERIGVVLDLETYQRLSRSQTDPELMLELSIDELQALANSALAVEDQTCLNNLLTKNKNEQLSTEEVDILDRLLAQIDQLNILKTRARYTLRYLQDSSAVAS